MGDYVRVKFRRKLSTIQAMNSKNTYLEDLLEGVVSSVLFDNIFELSYVFNETPKSSWIDLDDPNLIRLEIV